jgi:mono/diheme cytochrome c family protein
MSGRRGKWRAPLRALTQGWNSRGGRAQRLGLLICIVAVSGLGISASADPTTSGATPTDRALTPDEVKALKNPIPYTQASISRGQVLFTSNCTRCHGEDGKAQVDIIANATDLTEPLVYKHGTGVGDIYHSIRDGAGMAMPAHRTVIKNNDDLWNLVNFIQSLWPIAKQPPLQDR